MPGIDRPAGRRFPGLRLPVRAGTAAWYGGIDPRPKGRCRRYTTAEQQRGGVRLTSSSPPVDDGVARRCRSVADAAHLDLQHGQADFGPHGDARLFVRIPVLDAQHGQKNPPEARNFDDVAAGPPKTRWLRLADQRAFERGLRFGIRWELIVASEDRGGKVLSPNARVLLLDARAEAGVLEIGRVLRRFGSQEVEVQVDIHFLAGDPQIFKARAEESDCGHITHERMISGNLRDDAVR